ncbi:hypothetical protein Scep_010759 [Stephania cephalantha]|uniref:Uncharacterized protein n=1 Tax=Stephania cephalantha TaxID=152367 RepID=A0AAP0JWZ9_9MAGN
MIVTIVFTNRRDNQIIETNFIISLLFMRKLNTNISISKIWFARFGTPGEYRESVIVHLKIAPEVPNKTKTIWVKTMIDIDHP